MAYNNYFPMNYQNPYSYAPQQPVVQQQPQSNNGLIWVQGEAGAKSYLVAPNTTVMLMDSENQRFFLKSADASGMPLPLRTFEYKEIAENTNNLMKDTQTINTSNFATKDELEAFKSEIRAFIEHKNDEVKGE